MISESELEELLERARGNPEVDQEFFQRLLGARVYAHVPISDDSGKVRLIQFKHPDGFDALPFFTSESKAAAAAGRSARIVSFTGRELLEVTRGATLMLNPNGWRGRTVPGRSRVLADHWDDCSVEQGLSKRRASLVRRTGLAAILVDSRAQARVGPAEFRKRSLRDPNRPRGR